MKLAIYIRTVETARGAEQVSVNVALGLADLEHEVDFLVEEEQGWLVKKLNKHKNISVINLCNNKYRLWNRIFQIVALLRSLFLSSHELVRPDRRWFGQISRLVVKDNPPIYALYCYIKSQQPTVVLSYLNYPNLVLLMTAILARGSTRYLVSVRNHISTASARTSSKWVRSVPNLMRRYFRLADRVVAPSQGVADDVIAITGLPRDRISVVHNPVFRPEIITLSEVVIHHEWLHESTIPVIVAAGKLKPQKDFQNLLRAFSKVRKRREVRLIIMGEGKGRQALEQLVRDLRIENDVDMPGHIENPYPYFRHAAVFVLSSAWEGLPNTLIEAMACGCPVVATDCPSGPNEILDGGEIGKLVPVGDIDAMAKAIEETLTSPAPKEVFVDRAKIYSFDRVVADYERILSER